MAIHLKDAVIAADGHYLSGDTNSVTLNPIRAERDRTTFGSDGWVTRTAGLKSWTLTASGFYTPETDAANYTGLGVAKTFIVAASHEDGATAYCARGGITFNHEISGSAEEEATFSLTAMSNRSALLRGKVVVPYGTVDATTAGEERELGALSAEQTLYAFVHVLGVSGTTPDLDVVIQSDSTAGFSSPTDQITISNLNTVGASVGTKAGAVTDTYWRASLTVGGTDPEFTVLIAVAIA